MSKKYLFEIPESPDTVVFRAGREIAIDGRTVVEVELKSACAGRLMSPTAMAYCAKHWFNPVFLYSNGNLPVLIGFVFDEESFNSFSSARCTAGANFTVAASGAPICVVPA